MKDSKQKQEKTSLIQIILGTLQENGAPLPDDEEDDTIEDAESMDEEAKKQMLLKKKEKANGDRSKELSNAIRIGR